MSKIAPTVQDAIFGPGPWDPSRGPDERARAELRALLSVARAAQHTQHGEWCGYLCNCGKERLDRALARLSRVSGGRR